MIVTAKIIGYDGKNMVVIPDASIDKELIQKQINRVEIRLNDGRTITAEQRKRRMQQFGIFPITADTPPSF